MRSKLPVSLRMAYHRGTMDHLRVGVFTSSGRQSAQNSVSLCGFTHSQALSHTHTHSHTLSHTLAFSHTLTQVWQGKVLPGFVFACECCWRSGFYLQRHALPLHTTLSKPVHPCWRPESTFEARGGLSRREVAFRLQILPATSRTYSCFFFSLTLVTGTRRSFFRGHHKSIREKLTYRRGVRTSEASRRAAPPGGFFPRSGGCRTCASGLRFGF